MDESWTIKKAEHQRIDASELWCWRILRVPWTARRPNQSILKEMNPEYSLGGLMLKLKLQYWPHDAKSQLIRKDHDAWKDWRQEVKGTTEEQVVVWHHLLNGHDIEQAPRDCDGHGCLVCCSRWGRKESDATEWLNNKNFFYDLIIFQIHTDIKTAILVLVYITFLIHLSINRHRLFPCPHSYE